MRDHYLDGVYRWWHLSGPSPELLEVERDGWLGPPDNVIDIGCGLGSEITYLGGRGWKAVGVDLSAAALRRASSDIGPCSFVRADALWLPFPDRSFGLAIDRGCFHYLAPDQWSRYAAEAARVLRPGGRLLLRACLNSQGRRNAVTEPGIRSAFADWMVDELADADLVSDTRTMPALVVRLRRG